jgi:phage gp36-like protein
MAYTTEAIMIEEFGEEEIIELLDRDNDDSADSGALDRAIGFVDSVIDGFLRGRYTLPLTGAPEIVVGIANDLVRYRLYDTKAPEEVAKRKDRAMALLKDISNGVIQLDTAQAEIASSSGTDYYAPDRIFTQDTLEDF